MDSRPKHTEESIMEELRRDALEKARRNVAPQVTFPDDDQPVSKKVKRLAPRDVKTRQIGGYK